MPLNSKELFDDISMNKFRIEHELGKGSYASVKLGYNKDTNDKYAFKFYQKYLLSDPYKMRNVKREISILKRIEHSNIIKLFYAIEERT